MNLVAKIKEIRYDKQAEDLLKFLRESQTALLYDFNQPDDTGDTPLIAALRMESVDIVKHQSVAKEELRLVLDLTKENIIIEILEPLQGKFASMLYKRTGANPNKANEITGEFPLEIAARLEQDLSPAEYVSFVGLLLGRGADPNQINVKTQTYALYVVFNREKKSQTSFQYVDLLLKDTEVLLKFGALPDPMYKNQLAEPVGGDFPLLAAVKMERFDIVELLVQYGADRNRIKKSTGSFPLLEAAKNGNYDIAEALLSENFIAEGKNPVKPPSNPKMMNYKTGYFPLTMALQNEHYGIAKLLVDAGGMTPEHPTLSSLIVKVQLFIAVAGKMDTTISGRDMTELVEKLEKMSKAREDNDINLLMTNLKKEREEIIQLRNYLEDLKSNFKIALDDANRFLPFLLKSYQENAKNIKDLSFFNDPISIQKRGESQSQIYRLQRISMDLTHYYKEYTKFVLEELRLKVDYFENLTLLYKILNGEIKTIPKKVSKFVKTVSAFKKLSEKNPVLRFRLKLIQNDLKKLKPNAYNLSYMGKISQSSKQSLTQMLFPSKESAMELSGILSIQTYASVLLATKSEEDIRAKKVKELIEQSLSRWIDKVD